ncbi:chromate transporter [Inhella gelatinilytica]|uniref:Chromate transporter n=1 Tax=Inhella gelatinilytica TaxID=2795030 RepID=A0A931NA05_9BURK|nr:chromate transporter [Inhella gelatinilytica]MBH9551943.1 chromate transporter [Inhella gelatinilytica]
MQQYAWVSIGQVMDALALGETTPGPLLMVLVFLGWVAGWQQSVPGLPPVAAAALSACVVAYFSFLPSFALILLGAPWVERTRRLPRWEAPLKAVAAAVVGVIVHLAAVLAMHAWVADGRVNGHAVLLSALTLVGLWRWPRWGLAWVAGAAVLGAAL